MPPLLLLAVSAALAAAPDLSTCWLDCSEPQPRVHAVEDLLGARAADYLSVGHAGGGRMVVLPKCTADGGCCTKQGTFCAPASSEFKNITFFGTKATMTAPGLTGFFNLTVEVHTRCTCKRRVRKRNRNRDINKV